MPTATDQRTLITMAIPASFLKIIQADAEFTGLSFAPMMRRIVKWHRGLSAERHQSAPKVKLPKKSSSKKINKSFMLDDGDATYLADLGKQIGISRVQVMSIILLQWFGVPVFPPKT